MDKNNFTDIAIVGGGIAGLYAAWRLLEDARKRRIRRSIHLFEAHDRLGGRIYSIEIPRVPICAELGAWRFRKSQKLISQLIKSLKLEQHSINGDMKRRFFVRGRRLFEEKLKGTSARTPFRFARDLADVQKNPDALVIFAIKKALRELWFADPQSHQEQQILIKLKKVDLKSAGWPDPKVVDKITLTDWEVIKEKGVIRPRSGDTPIPLYATGFWNLLQHYLGNEGFLFAHDTFGYESILGNWNAGEAIKWFLDDFAESNYYIMLTKGFADLVRSLSDEIKKGGGAIHLDSKLDAINRKDDESLWELTFQSKKGIKSVVEAEQVILALPKATLMSLIEPLDERWIKLTEQFEAVQSHSLFKVFLVYEQPWWERKGLRFPDSPLARVFTDLPLRQVYYFPTTWMEKQASVKRRQGQSNWAMIMASYSDAHYIEFWLPFFLKADNGEKNYFKPPEGLSKEEEDKLKAINDVLGLPERMVDKIRNQLAELHGVNFKRIPNPIMGIYFHWGEKQGDGWHTWNVNRKPWNVTEYLLNPMEGLYICGEAYSSEQGWVEGALKSTERVLTEKLGLSKPDWYDGDDFEEYIKS